MQPFSHSENPTKRLNQILNPINKSLENIVNHISLKMELAVKIEGEFRSDPSTFPGGLKVSPNTKIFQILISHRNYEP